MAEVLYNGVGLVALVMGVVQVIKKTGLSGNRVRILAVCLAFLVFTGGKAAELYPVIAPWFELILAGLYGVSAIGMYDVVKGSSMNGAG